MNRSRSIALAAVLAGLAPLAATPAQAAPTPAATTSYTAAESATYPYSARGVRATITITRVADTAYSVSITGTAQTSTPTTIPVKVTSGLMMATGTYPMASRHGTMTLSPATARFAFHRTYTANYTGPYTFSGSWMTVVTTAQTSIQTITIGGHSYRIGVKAPATHARADGKGHRIMVNRTFEVDRAVLSSQPVVVRYFRADDDRRLGFRELSDLYLKNPYRASFHEDYRFVTVRVGKDATPAEVRAAINQKMPRGWAPLTSGAPQSPTRHKATRKAPVIVTTAWELNTRKGAKPQPGGAAWGPKRNLQEVYIGTSNHR